MLFRSTDNLTYSYKGEYLTDVDRNRLLFTIEIINREDFIIWCIINCKFGWYNSYDRFVCILGFESLEGELPRSKLTRLLRIII